MIKNRNICAISSTRADYGLLLSTLTEINNSSDFTLQLIVTGTHLSKAFGETVTDIKVDGFKPAAEFSIISKDDSATGIANNMAKAIETFSVELQTLKPDLLLILGDRYEILASVIAASFLKIPVAHLFGGDLTIGALDDDYRHAITKMAHLHFVTNEISRDRVIQLGENPKHVFNVGSPGLDLIRQTSLLDQQTLAQDLNIKFRKHNLLITFHPVTKETNSVSQLQKLFEALDQLGKDTFLIFTAANADAQGQEINKHIEEFVHSREQAVFFKSLGHIRYFSMISHVDAVVGNSSSGIYEVPSFKKPTINIGRRQEGRLQATSIINCVAESGAILNAIRRAQTMDCSGSINPYGDGYAAQRIINALRTIKDYSSLIEKMFYDNRATSETKLNT
ncbi:MAG: UDP-N-acetylglucosamine 2-epimerase (hydrolyzing) [Bdellovibrionales bacterium]|nr:UDP-N-acetylglucosamine 2-epimerase (hydrolyzing) [Bdellovibrionales bacterium]